MSRNRLGLNRFYYNNTKILAYLILEIRTSYENNYRLNKLLKFDRLIIRSIKHSDIDKCFYKIVIIIYKSVLN